MENQSVKARGVRLKKKILRDARKAAGMTQVELAAAVNRVGMSAWRAENGYPIEVAHAKQIAKALKLDLAELIRK